VLVPGLGRPGTDLALQLSETPVQAHLRIHFDLYAGGTRDQAAETERRARLGAEHVDRDLYPDRGCFCLIDTPHG
jgi:hypothetical protein